MPFPRRPPSVHISTGPVQQGTLAQQAAQDSSAAGRAAHGGGGTAAAATRRGPRLAVQSVVDVVDDVLGLGLEEDEAGLVLLHRRRLGRGELALGVHLARILVRRVGDQFSSRVGVHTRQLDVDADVGVVHVDRGRATKEANAGVVNLSVRGSSRQQRGGAKHLAEDLAARDGLRHRRRSSTGQRRGAQRGRRERQRCGQE
eukprot:CAMPEP_0202761748 /NCGR_PEP_ID=MMETSP1388-20130828/20411_1 /ASSEMBLY_ACC=CAM_ASM_000864 /TAXON_ID=37098 /ORGANISM="Isochrysis sp, Strain CCMP1244" /LENGTH=200 /DNA_ID=CAMNT_0049429907 /DNA_START=114 /DNA_END=717 /DNA_ORIENTATION=-